MLSFSPSGSVRRRIVTSDAKPLVGAATNGSSPIKPTRSRGRLHIGLTTFLVLAGICVVGERAQAQGRFSAAFRLVQRLGGPLAKGLPETEAVATLRSSARIVTVDDLAAAGASVPVEGVIAARSRARTLWDEHKEARELSQAMGNAYCTGLKREVDTGVPTSGDEFALFLADAYFGVSERARPEAQLWRRSIT